MKRRRVLSLILSLIMVLNMLPITAFDVEAASSVQGYGETKVVKATEYAIAPGVTETDIILNNASGNAQVMGYMTEIDLSKEVEIKASYGGYYNGTDPNKWKVPYWNMASTTNQALAYEKSTGENVVVATNGDYFNMSTGQPLGPLVMNGVDCNPDNSASEPYFAILKDGSAVIRDRGTSLADVKEAIAGPFYLVKDGKNVIDPANKDLMPRNSIGVKTDGTVVLFLADGRQAPISVGMSLYEMAQFYIAQGVENALYLDGGGSATYITEREGTGEFTVKNSPADGYERNVSSALLVVSTAKPSGVFDHAAVVPVNEIYTPNSKVQFSATGVDSAGAVAELPTGLTWALASASADMGSIDKNSGLFTAGDKTGTVTVELKQGTAVVGTTSIQIQKPTEIAFLNDSINLAYGQETNLGLTVSYNGSEMKIKEGDIVWTIGDSRAGSFNGNTFIASENNATKDLTVTTTVTGTSSWDSSVKGSIQVGVGTEPVVVLDGGDADGHNYNNIAYVYADANGGNLVYETHADDHGDVVVVHYAGRGGVASAEVCDVDTGKVRFGEKALKLNYDFTNLTGIEGACVGFAQDITIEGSPTGIGFWLYAPENTPNLWVRIRIKDGSGTILTKDFTTRYDYATDGTCGGINWVGWKYLECDLSDIPGPITLLGGETIRIMDTNGAYGKDEIVVNAGMGTVVCQQDSSGKVAFGPTYVGHQKGVLYIDNLQLVYGTNNADIGNPEITKIQAGKNLNSAVELASDGSTVINSNEVTFYSEFKEDDGEYATGLDFAYVYLDGVNMSDNDNCAVNIGDGKLTLNAIKLANGTHSVKILVRDKYGNESVVTRTFNVQGNDTTLTAVNLEPLSEAALIGDTYQLALTSNNIADVNAVDTTIQIGEGVSVKQVNFSSDFAGSTFEYDEASRQLKINAKRSELQTAAEGDIIATIDVTIPSEMPSGSVLTYSVLEGIVTYVGAKDDSVVNTFATAPIRKTVEAAYKVNVGEMIVGAKNGTLTIEGKTVSNVEVYLEKDGTDVLLGTTDKNGKLVTDAFCSELCSFVVYAKGADGYSFPTKGQSFAVAGDDSGKPIYIVQNIVESADKEKSISWITNPLKSGAKATIRYGLKKDFAAGNYTTVSGESVVKTFAGGSDISDNTVVRINSVLLKGLKADTEYSYQVGDGSIWSEVKTFKTSSVDDSVATNFFVIGDTQTVAGETEGLTTINKLIAEDDAEYSFGIQTGDAIEEPGLYKGWVDFLNVFSTGALGSTDLMHVVGNHELFGDAGASATNALFATPDDNYYSVEYGNVYVATISYTTDTARLTEMMNWLKEDAAKSNATWKILALHQPPYYTNVEGGNAAVHEVIPAAVDAAGIDLVFSGHDHTYARTEPMTAGNVDKENGAVYYICGSTGEKSYSVTNNPDFNFAVATQDYNGIYIGVEADWKELNVTTYNILPDGSKEIFDVYKKALPLCENDEHNYVYYRDTDLMKCTDCVYRCDASDSYFSGWVTDAENSEGYMYFVGGKYMTGYQYIGSTAYYLDDNGIAYHGTKTICGEKCTFEKGVFVKAANAKVKLAGMCGPEAEFVLYTSGLLKLAGKGETYKYETYGTVPWVNERQTITEIEIGKDITTLGDFLFRGATACESVTFEKGSVLTTIGEQVFYYHSSLKELVLPDAVKTIGGLAIANCAKLAYVYMPDGVSKISKSAFYYDNFDKLTLSVLDQSYAHEFAKTNNIKVTVRELPPTPPAPLYSGSCGENVTYELWADGTLKLLGSGATTNYASYKDVPWFEYRSMITNIVIDKDITVLGDYLFRGATNCESVTFEEGSKLTTIGAQVFYYFSELEEIKLPETVESIGYMAFGNSKKLASVYVPEDTSKINNTAFSGCGSVLVLEVAENSYAHKYAKENNIKVKLREGTKPPVEEKPLYNGKCGEAVTYELWADGTLKLLGSGATATYASYRDVPWYEYRSMITNIVIDKDITVLGDYLFRGATNCESVTFEKGSKLTTIGAQVFYYFSELEEIKLPETVQSIGYMAFGNSKKLANVYVPETITKINNTAFANCGSVLVLEVVEDSYAHNYAKENNIKVKLRKGAEKPLYSGKCGEDVTYELWADGTLKLLGSGATATYTTYKDVPWYEYRSMIKNIVIDKDITVLGDYVFRGATNCVSVTFEEGSELTTIGAQVFYYFSALEEIKLPETVQSIGYMAFGNSKKLANVYIPETMAVIHATAFSGCSSALVLEVVEDSYAHNYAKENNIKVELRKGAEKPLYSGKCGEDVTYELWADGTLKLLGSGATATYTTYKDVPWYEYRSTITNIVIDKDITVLGDYMFRGATNCVSVTFEEGSKLTTIGAQVFYYFSALEEIKLPETVETIGYMAFGNNAKLRSIYVPETVSTVHDTAFSGCNMDKLEFVEK